MSSNTYTDIQCKIDVLLAIERMIEENRINNLITRSVFLPLPEDEEVLKEELRIAVDFALRNMHKSMKAKINTMTRDIKEPKSLDGPQDNDE